MADEIVRSTVAFEGRAEAKFVPAYTPLESLERTLTTMIADIRRERAEDARVQRWCAIASTHLETAFMFIEKALKESKDDAS